MMSALKSKSTPALLLFLPSYLLSLNTYFFTFCVCLFYVYNLNHSWFSASDLSSLPRTHILAIVDWAVFANVSTSDVFPPPAVGKVRDWYHYHYGPG